MGLVDVLKADGECPSCGKSNFWRLQFKYGYCRQNERVIGDSIEWSSDHNYQYGRNVGGTVRTLGVSEAPCKHCGTENVFGIIYLTDNKLTKVEFGSEELDFGQEMFESLGGQSAEPEEKKVTPRPDGWIHCPHCEYGFNISRMDFKEGVHGRCNKCGCRIFIVE